jgi:hypothetical protein
VKKPDRNELHEGRLAAVLPTNESRARLLLLQWQAETAESEKKILTREN